MDTWKYIQEDKVERYRYLLQVIPLARTPMDGKGGRAMQHYAKQIERNLDKMVPWRKVSSRLADLRGKVKPGEVVVLLEGDEAADHPLYRGAKVKRE